MILNIGILIICSFWFLWFVFGGIQIYKRAEYEHALIAFFLASGFLLGMFYVLQRILE